MGAWFAPPIDMEEMEERIGLDDKYTLFNEIYRLCELVSEIEGTPLYDELKEVQGMWFNSLGELLEHQENIICFSDCDSVEDVAHYYVEETG